MARRKCIVGGDLSHGTQSNVDGDDTVLFLRGVRCGSGTTRFCSKYCIIADLVMRIRSIFNTNTNTTVMVMTRCCFYVVFVAAVELGDCGF